MGLIILLVLIVVLIGGAPVYPYSRTWGWGPSSGILVVLLIVLILAYAGRLPLF